MNDEEITATNNRSNGLAINNIRLNMIQVAFLLIQTASIVWFFAHMDSGIQDLNKTVLEIKQAQGQDNTDLKIWKAKVEVDIADLKARLAVIEDREAHRK